ncbi:hypothetical protein VNO77_07481 [Canavalia gladiata]|uniref:Uncharacterized protein n=1 Tax=Canavalia gladiata TaxID=3824 RepID=A0AAN9M7N2_CANGL
MTRGGALSHAWLHMAALWWLAWGSSRWLVAYLGGQGASGGSRWLGDLPDGLVSVWRLCVAQYDVGEELKGNMAHGVQREDLECARGISATVPSALLRIMAFRFNLNANLRDLPGVSLLYALRHSLTDMKIEVLLPCPDSQAIQPLDSWGADKPVHHQVSYNNAGPQDPNKGFMPY